MDEIDDIISKFRVGSRYTGQFAGVWYGKDGRLNVGVTNSSTISRNEEVVYHTFQFSYNFLNMVHGLVVDLMQSYSITGVATLPQYNHVQVRVSDEDVIKNITKALPRTIDITSVDFIVDYELPTTERIDLHAGSTVGRALVSVGTLGAAHVTCMSNGSIRGVLTNEHVAPRGTILRHGGSSIFNPVIGQSIRAQYGGRIDAAFVQFDNPFAWNAGSSVTDGNTIIPATSVLSRNSIRVGLPVAQFGQTTGRTIGHITSINEAFPSTRFGHFHSYIRSTYRSASGDSGGPVLTFDGSGGYSLVGIHSHSGGLASNIRNVMADLNVGIVVGERAPEIDFAGGTGTSSDPFEIGTPTHLNSVRYFPSSHFKLINNINLFSFPHWPPIPILRGTLDGNGHTITGMNISRTSTHAINTIEDIGMISRLYGTISNLTISNSNIYQRPGHTGTGWIRVGILAGCIGRGGTVENVSIIDSTVTVHRNQSEAGGIAGITFGTILDSEVINIEVMSNGDTGGLIGTMDEHSLVKGNTVSDAYIRHWHHTSNRSIGGLIGLSRRGDMINNTILNTQIHQRNPGSPNIGVLAGCHRTATVREVSGNVMTSNTLRLQYGSPTPFAIMFGRMLSWV